MGRALLQSVQSWAQERGADGISLQVAAANSRGRKFYEDLGFREVSVFQVFEFYSGKRWLSAVSSLVLLSLMGRERERTRTPVSGS